MRLFDNIWRDATAERPPSTQGAAGELLAAIANKLDVDQVGYADLPPSAFFLLDLSKLGFKGMDLNVVMVAHPPEDDATAQTQAGLLAQYKHAVESFGFCFVIYLGTEADTVDRSVPEWLESVLLKSADLRRMLDSPLPSSVLFEAVRCQVRLALLCPFNTTHAARGDTFRGRKRELERLTLDLDSGFLISGARRIGKTSLLKRACHELHVRGPYRRLGAKDERVFYFDCLTWRDYWDCCYRMAHSIDPRLELRIEKGPRNISYLLERKSHGGQRPLLLFFDEMDVVINTDSHAGWPFLRLLAEAAHRRWIRVVFAGYRSMYQLLFQENVHPNSVPDAKVRTPFDRALEPLMLRPLSQSDTGSLVREPFERVGIPLRDEDALLRRIWEGTRGNPWLIQFYGEQLFRSASERVPQEVHFTDLEELEGGFELGDFLMTHFLENTLEHGQPVPTERLCAFLFAHHDVTPCWAVGDFVAACRGVGSNASLNEVNSALRNLCYTGLLSFEHDRYFFALPIIRRKLRNSFPDLSQVLPELLPSHPTP